MRLIFLLLIGSWCSANEITKSMYDLAEKNGYKPEKRVIQAIYKASMRYKINPLELTAIGIIETGLGKYSMTRTNSNGTKDQGLFQINSVNASKCDKFDLSTIEGSAFCAAKLLSSLKKQYSAIDDQWLARYHSKTPKYKNKYVEKLSQVLFVLTDN